MIIVDRLLTVNRINKHMKQLAETMSHYKVYQKNLQLAKELSDLIKDDDAIRRILFSLNTLKSPVSLELLKNNGRADVASYIEKNIPQMSHEDTSVFKLLVNAEINRVVPENIENMAFAGGGAKGMAYPGVLRRVAELSMNIKRVSGTSAGAITALPFALGYSPKKIEEIVLKYDFTEFMHESVINNNILLKNTMMKAMMHKSQYLKVFKEKFEDLFLEYLRNNPIFFNRFDVPIALSPEMKAHPVTGRLIVKKHYEEEFLTSPKLKTITKTLALDDELKRIISEAQKNAADAYKESLKSETDKVYVNELLNNMHSKMGNQFDKNDRKYIKTLIEFFRLERKEDLIEEFFGDLIEGKVGRLAYGTLHGVPKKDLLEQISEGLSSHERLRNVTFKEFKKIREVFKDSDPAFKDLAICICEKISDNPLKLFSKDNYRQIDVYADNPDPVYSDMPIKTAVRISMNLPGAFSSYVYKDKKYVDGGVRANFPMHFFDQTLGLDRRTTIGVCLAPAANYTRTEDADKVLNPDRSESISQNNLLKRAIIHVKNYLGDVITQIHGNKLDNNKPLDFLDLTRIGVINVMNIDTTDFNLDMTKKVKLFKQGYYTAYDMLKPDYNAQLRHYVERMKVIYSNVEEDLALLKNISESKHDSLIHDLDVQGHNVDSFKNYIDKMQDTIHYNLGGRMTKRKPQI